LICDLSNRELDFSAYLVIDSTIRGKCAGGIRMTSEVTLHEIAALAKNMTLKYGFLGIPMGGAKVGIHIGGPLSKLKRKSIFIDIGKSLGPLILRKCYYPGTDIGTTDQDINILFNAATHETTRWESMSIAKYTSWTMIVSALEVLNELCLKMDASTVAIQGFGRIGSSAAEIFSANGAKIVAVSAEKGAIYNSEGLDIAKLLELQKKFGGDFVNQTSIVATKISKDELLYLPVDILLPCAGSWLINSKNCHKIRSKIICPGANIPITNEADEHLYNKGVLVLPDFVSNSGGVLGASIRSFATEQQIRQIVEKEFRKRVFEVINLAKEEGVSPIKVAEKIAMKRFNELKANCEKKNERQRIYEIWTRGIIPKVYYEIFGKRRALEIFVKRLRSTG
jgi:glutamate dehydrogenase (NAD(P)+)